MITDCKSTGSLEQWALYAQFKAAAAITKGYCVTLGTNGQITVAATNALQTVIGVAAESVASGEVCNVIVLGYCDYIVCGETYTDITAPADAGTGDQVLVVINGGGVVGRTRAELDDNSVAGNMIVAKNLGVPASATGCYGWVICGSGTFAKNV